MWWSRPSRTVRTCACVLALGGGAAMACGGGTPAPASAGDVEACLEAGMNGHLGKPVSLPALREALDRRIPPILDDALLDELADSLGGRALVNQMLEVFRTGLPERLQNLRAAGTPETLRENEWVRASNLGRLAS